MLDDTTAQAEVNLAKVGSVNWELEQRRASSCAAFCAVLGLMVVVVLLFVLTLLLIQFVPKSVPVPVDP